MPITRDVDTSKVTSLTVIRFRAGYSKQPDGEACGPTQRSGRVPGSCDGGGILRSSALHHPRPRSPISAFFLTKQRRNDNYHPLAPYGAFLSDSLLEPKPPSGGHTKKVRLRLLVDNAVEELLLQRLSWTSAGNIYSLEIISKNCQKMENDKQFQLALP